MHLTPDSCVILFQNQETDPDNRFRSQIEAFFASHHIGLETVVLASRNSPPADRPRFKTPDLVLVLGGDGTFLRAVRMFAPLHAPLVGINTGHLGFLTKVEANQIDFCLNALLAGETDLEQRMMLVVGSDRQLALNDVVLKNANPSRLASIRVFVDGHLLADYDADGLIIATPTGSTAYNLSAGGPIMAPQVNVLAITPICPHSLSAKPIIVSAGQVLRLASDPKNTEPLLCAVDGDDAFKLAPGEAFEISQSDYKLPLVKFRTEADDFYAILKRKLGWGANPRAVAMSAAHRQKTL